MVNLDSSAVLLIVAGVFALVIVPPSLFFFIRSFWGGRNNIEWARSSYAYFQPAFGLFILDCVLQAAVHSVSAVTNLLGPSEVSDTLQVAFGYVHPVARLFDSITEILVFLCLINLAAGIIKAQAGVYRFHQLVRIGQLLFVFALSGLTTYSLVASLWAATTESIELNYDDYCFPDNCGYGYAKLIRTGWKVDAAFAVIVWVLSMCMTIWSVLLAYRSNGERRVKRTTIYLVVCSVCWLLRTSYTFAMENRFHFNGFWRHGHTYSSVGLGYVVVNVPMTLWTMFIILVLLYLLGKNENDGLWVTDVNEPSSKAIQVNQSFKSFQNIVIPVQADQERADLSSRGQDSSPLSTHNQIPMSPPPAFHASLYSERNDPPTPSHEPAIELTTRPQNHDWVRPPSGAPPSLDIRAASPPSHEDLMGFNHQADGYMPSAPLPYAEKS